MAMDSAAAVRRRVRRMKETAGEPRKKGTERIQDLELREASCDEAVGSAVANCQRLEPPKSDIADKLLPAWDTPYGIPYNMINLAAENPHNPSWIGVEKVITELRKNFPADGLLPIFLNPYSGSSSYSTITFGAMGDKLTRSVLTLQGKHGDPRRFWAGGAKFVGNWGHHRRDLYAWSSLGRLAKGLLVFAPGFSVSHAHRINKDYKEAESVVGDVAGKEGDEMLLVVDTRECTKE
ncbi:hypothetical protein Syun_014154 [Stephania yunnanensis]|uniref:Uncharacterized protein n=1 Tax=Stephania yunnanensis TaxID=152371 RepID=A0AAP0JJ82_9MAGN